MASPPRWTLMLTAALAQPAWAQCPGNVIEMADDAVNGADLAQVLSLWGSCGECAADLNGDGQVNGADIAIVLSNWGRARRASMQLSPHPAPTWAARRCTCTENGS